MRRSPRSAMRKKKKKKKKKKNRRFFLICCAARRRVCLFFAQFTRDASVKDVYEKSFMKHRTTASATPALSVVHVLRFLPLLKNAIATPRRRPPLSSCLKTERGKSCASDARRDPAGVQP